MPAEREAARGLLTSDRCSAQMTCSSCINSKLICQHSTLHDRPNEATAVTVSKEDTPHCHNQVTLTKGCGCEVKNSLAKVKC